VIRSSHSSAAIGRRASSTIASTRSGRDTPAIVETIRGSRSENWSAAAARGTSCRAQAAFSASIRARISGLAARYAYSLEAMPWALPDSPDSYLELMGAIDRPRFAAHLDPVNLVNSPAKYYDTAGLLRECFAKLGPHIRCCHAKDVTLANELTVDLAEVVPGRGALDYRVLLTEMDRLDPDTPILVEHLADDREYTAATAHIRSVADSLGLKT
jgi:sugar phosphate isomerase/epimerase